MHTELLSELPTRINREYKLATDAAHTAIEHAIKAGELLMQAKQAVKHGDWLPWLEKHCTISERTARNYMRLAKLPEAKRQRVADMPLRQAIEAMAEPNQPAIEDTYNKVVALLEEVLQQTEKDMQTFKDSETFNAATVDRLTTPYDEAKKQLAVLVGEVERLHFGRALYFFAQDTALERLTAKVRLQAERFVGQLISKGLIQA